MLHMIIMVLLWVLLCILAGVLGFGAAMINCKSLTIVLFLICLMFGAFITYGLDVNQKLPHSIKYEIPSEIETYRAIETYQAK